VLLLDAVAQISDDLVEVLLVDWREDHLEQFPVRRTFCLQSKTARITGPRLRVHLRIVECHGEFHVVLIQPMPPLGYQHVLAERHSPLVTPESWIEARRVDDECIAVPSSDRISIEPWTGILGHFAIVRPDFAPDAEPFEKLY